MVRFINKCFTKDSLLSSIISVLLSIGLVLIFALFVKWFCLSTTAINIGNTFVKVLSLFFGLFLGIKERESGLIKGIICGLIYSVLSSFLFSLYAGGGLFYGFNLLDLLFCVIIGGISGIIIVNIRK